ncbi:hypothetical protein [Candidatus Enterococcus mansonii]|uniref:SD-repeat containing protein B domain-containing protein n=1 Tax=Candidatus Enterococcus mansonii TaxID=1834181 RepID=A0A242C7V3_9ENTE|nr:hypothetical protein [Enterococcus sp. 4G2_DIV0659]OTO05872.1 hypothetical protein A5880_003047 [Enterococcus sp. 4G2_DIV0659]
MSRKRMLICLFMLLVFLGWQETADAAKPDFSINTISGVVYRDMNENGIMELKNLEIAAPKQQIGLYSSVEDAQNDQNSLKKTTSNSVGLFSFTRLKRGTYYLRYNFDATYRPILFEGNAVDGNNQQLGGIVKIDATSPSKFLYTKNLPLKKITSLDILPFEDKNWNGLMDEEESIMNGKTMMILNLRRLAEVVKNGELKSLDVPSLVLGSLNGNVDIADAIYLRTTKNGQLINIPDVKSDLYIIVRSPFNLTISDMVTNISKVKAIIEIVLGGDLTGILNNPELISTGDIDTNSDNDYIKLLASILPKIADEADKLDYSKLLGEETATSITKTINQIRQLGTLIDHIPATRFAKVDYFGNSYDLTGLKFKKTNQFFFGIKQYASISGYVFNDSNLNGQKDTFETLKSVDLTAYDENGNILTSVKTPTTFGEFKISQLSYGQNIYLGISSDAPVAPEMIDGKPAALADKKIIACYYFEKTSAITTIKQNIGIANVSDIGIRVKKADPATNSAIVTFSNKNSIPLTVSYSLNEQETTSFGIKAKGIFSKESVQDVSLTDLFEPGMNKITGNWTNGVYTGPKMEFTF